MHFKPKGLRPDVAALFRTKWIDITKEENSLLFGKHYISAMQRMTIDMYTNFTECKDSENLVVSTVNDAQGEFEALIRARSRVLATLLAPEFARDKL